MEHVVNKILFKKHPHAQTNIHSHTHTHTSHTHTHHTHTSHTHPHTHTHTHARTHTHTPTHTQTHPNTPPPHTHTHITHTGISTNLNLILHHVSFYVNNLHCFCLSHWVLEKKEEAHKSVKEEEEDGRNTMQGEVINYIKKSQKRGENYCITYEIPIFLILKYSIPRILELSNISLITPTKRTIFTVFGVTVTVIFENLCASYLKPLAVSSCWLCLLK